MHPIEVDTGSPSLNKGRYLICSGCRLKRWVSKSDESEQPRMDGKLLLPKACTACGGLEVEIPK